MSLNIRVIQMQVIQGDFNKNLIKVVEHIKEASANNVDLVIFPQYTITGYPTNDVITELGMQKVNDEAKISSMAKQYGVNVIYNHVEPQKYGFADYTIYVDKNGDIKEKYNRVSKFWREDRCIVGNECKTIEVNGVKIGLMAGDDIYYPEIARELALQNAAAIVCLFYNSNHRLGNSFDVKSVLTNMISTYAIVNEVDFILCSAEGSIDYDDNQSIISGSMLIGQSCIFSISKGKFIKVNEITKAIDTSIDSSVISFYRMISRRLENARLDVYKSWRGDEQLENSNV